MRNHTPGPWELQECDGVITLDGWEPETVNAVVHIGPGGSRTYVAFFCKSKEDVGNAAMVVAAPRLLEACKYVVENWEHGDLAAAARACASAIKEAEPASKDRA